MPTPTGTYYYRNNFTMPIMVKQSGDGTVEASSSYWQPDAGVFEPKSSLVHWDRLGVGKVYDDRIEYSESNIWHKDKRKNLMFIGCNNIGEISRYCKEYNNGIFIEALSTLHKAAEVNLNKCNKLHNTNYRALCELITNEDGKEYDFNIFNNHGASSSIYEANGENWKWDNVKKVAEEKLTSVRMAKILRREGWDKVRFDAVLDTQGAELEVLKSFDGYLQNIERMKIEVSRKEFYKGGVLFEELDEYLKNNGFTLDHPYVSNIPEHGDVWYVNRKYIDQTAQLAQDLFVLNQTNHKKNGFFVEFGATDGIDLSNTYILEKDYGWTGILAEPARCWHTDLHRNRGCTIDTRCVWSETGKSLQFKETVDPAFSTIEKYANSDFHSKLRKNGEVYEVETISLMDLLDIHGAPSVIDYMSLDTEGSEYEILNDFDFDKYHIKIITCEHNYTNSRNLVFDLLTANGFRRVNEGSTRFDDWYVNTGR